MPVERLLPDAESEALVALAREIATDELEPIASDYEAKSEFPREQFRLLGRSGLLGLPYSQECGGGAVTYFEGTNQIQRMVIARELRKP
ncbi:MAG TPA: acyl-CoA dehydrogenase family protein [Trebonia sp.]|nr:acyl-CoA dehydrogenase family protein [Trebonia sp.]